MRSYVLWGTAWLASSPHRVRSGDAARRIWRSSRPSRLGDDETGLTIHRISPEFDTGHILAQTRVPITDDDDLTTLMAKLVDRAPGLLRQALERVARGDPGDAQDEGQATEAGLFEDAWR